jgi:hypothetical protein
VSTLVNPLVGAIIYAADLGSYYNLFKGIAGSGDTITQFYKGAAINSAAALTLGTDGNYFQVNGTTTITSISAAPAGTAIALQFAGALTLTHGAALRLSGAGNYTTAANDVFVFISDAGGNWREVCRTLASGISTAGTLTGSGLIIGTATTKQMKSRFINTAALNVTNSSAGSYVNFGGSFTTTVTTLANDQVMCRVQTLIRKETGGFAAFVIDQSGTKLPTTGPTSSVLLSNVYGVDVPALLETWIVPGAGTFTYKPQVYTNDANTAKAGDTGYCTFVVEVWQ